MKISPSLLKKIKTPTFIGFICASAVYLFSGTLLLSMVEPQPIKVKTEGNDKITLKLTNISKAKDHPTQQSKSKPKSKPKPPTKKSPPKPIPSPSPKPSPDPKPIEQTQEEPLQTQTDTAPIDTSPNNSQNQNGEKTQALVYNEGLSSEFLSKIHSAISSNKLYPRMARLRRMEGEIILEFILEPNGEVHGIKVISSTASDLLQQSAIKAIQKASINFPRPRETKIIKVPVTYSLTT